MMELETREDAEREELTDLFLLYSFCYNCHLEIANCKCKISEQVFQPAQFIRAIKEKFIGIPKLQALKEKYEEMLYGHPKGGIILGENRIKAKLEVIEEMME